MGDSLRYTLPLTTSTGRARIKRRNNHFGEPLSAKENKFKDSDYIEWQISYFVSFGTLWDNFRKAKNIDKKKKVFDIFSFFKDDKIITELKTFVEKNQTPRKKDFIEGIHKIFKKHKETIISKVHKNGQIYVMYELADLFRLALEQGVISEKEIKELLKFNGKEKIDIETQYNVSRTSLNKKMSDNFEYFEEKSPLFIKNINNDSFTEIQLKHKQKAVGYQSMIYFCIWLKGLKDNAGKSLIGRSAERKELITIDITKEEIIDIAKSFIIASKDHEWDMKTILKDLIQF